MDFEEMKSKATEFAEMFEDPLSSWWPWVVAGVVGLLTAVKSYMGGVECPSRARVEGQVAVVTGANCGIGFETARLLAARGAKVILACRDVDTGEVAATSIKEQVPNAQLAVRPLNLCSFASVRAFVQELEEPSVDILVNNAGVVFHPEARTEDGFEIHLQTNYLGPFLLTHLLLPKLRASGGGRVINVSAVAHFAGSVCLQNLNLEGCFTAREAFSQSKLAVIMSTIEMATRMPTGDGGGVTVNCLHPGMARGTRHMRHSPLSGSVVLRIPTLPWLWLLTKSAEQAAQTAIFLAVEPTLASVSGKYFADCEEKSPSEQTRDVAAREALYEKTCQLLDIKGLSKRTQNKH